MWKFVRLGGQRVCDGLVAMENRKARLNPSFFKSLAGHWYKSDVDSVCTEMMSDSANVGSVVAASDQIRRRRNITLNLSCPDAPEAFIHPTRRMCHLFRMGECKRG
jgi:hypothetical protein